MTNTEAWNYAIGMIRMDGLEPTEDVMRMEKARILKVPLWI